MRNTYVLNVRTTLTDVEEMYFKDRHEALDLARFIANVLEISGGRAVVEVVEVASGFVEYLHSVNGGIG